MDDPALPAADYERCLHDLAVVNRVTFTHRPTLRWLDWAVAGLPADVTIPILDVACGEGDLLRAIHRWAQRRGRRVQLTGLDLNPRSALAAAAQTPPAMAIAWRTGDVFEQAPDPRPDFIVTSQFTHHLTDADIVRFLRWLGRYTARGWFIPALAGAPHSPWLVHRRPASGLVGLLGVRAAGDRGAMAPDRP